MTNFLRICFSKSRGVVPLQYYTYTVYNNNPLSGKFQIRTNIIANLSIKIIHFAINLSTMIMMPFSNTGLKSNFENPLMTIYQNEFKFVIKDKTKKFH